MKQKLINSIEYYLENDFFPFIKSPGKEILEIIENEIFKKEVPIGDNDYSKGYNQAMIDIKREMFE